MQTSDIRFSHILISENIEAATANYEERLAPSRVISFSKDDFLIEDAKAVIAEAYIAEENEKFIILSAKTFNAVSQNALLKILEEPPRNIIFIIIAESKSTLLPTIRSRLLLKCENSSTPIESVALSLKRLDLNSMYAFIKEHERLKSAEAKAIVESIYAKAVFEEEIVLTEAMCTSFERAIRLIELNSKFSTILVDILSKFLPKVNHAY